MALGFGASCGTSKHAADDEGGPRAEGGESSEIAGSGGDDGVGGSAGASGGRGGSAGSAAGSAGSSTTGGVSAGDAGRGGASGGDPGTAGDAGRGGTSGKGGAGGKNGTGGTGGTGPRPTFSPKLRCDAPRWLTTVVQPLEATAPLAVTNGLGVFMVTTMISEEVNAFETWDNTVFSMERDGLYPNALQNTVGEGSHPRVGQLAMGRTGDGIWIQNPGIVGSSATTTLRRWDQAANAWDDAHPIPGMRASTMRAAFLDDHDVLVTGLMDEDIVSVVYDHESSTWSEPEPIGTLGTSVATNWGFAHFTLAADGAGNAAAVWARDETSGVRVMREGSWVGSAVSLPVDGMVLGFWDIAVVSAGGGNFEVVAGAQDQTRGVMMKAWTLAHDESAGTVLDGPADAGTLPMVINVSTGQPLTLQRDVDGDLTVAGPFWTDRPEYWAFRRTNGAWAAPEMLANGIIAANIDIGASLRTLALDSGGHALAVTANIDDELVLREVGRGSSTWTEGVRIDTADFRFNLRGASLVLDGDEPVIFFSAEGNGWGNVAWTACR
jgi:hypothetical protein